eukprot:3000422-Rhodomonas_salina.1
MWNEDAKGPDSGTTYSGYTCIPPLSRALSLSCPPSLPPSCPLSLLPSLSPSLSLAHTLSLALSRTHARTHARALSLSLRAPSSLPPRLFPSSPSTHVILHCSDQLAASPKLESAYAYKLVSAYALPTRCPVPT